MKVSAREVQSVDAWDDGEWQESVIASVTPDGDGWAVGYDGWTLWIRDNGIEPEIGDTIRTYGRGIGYEVRGIAINGLIVRYESAVDMESRYARESVEREAKRRADAIAAAPKTERRINALPENFRDRIAGFRARNPDFDWEHLPYELICCEQAVAFAKRFETVGALEAWHSLDWEKQKAICPELDEGHSGNSFGASCRLAHLHLTNPGLVPQEHGALCPLVGCRDYGCWAMTQEQETAA